MSRVYSSAAIGAILILIAGIAFSQTNVWQKLGSPQGLRVDQIAFDAKNDIFICTWWYPDSAVIDGNIDRIERSTDHGASWETMMNAS
jgi:hypothetical protein